MKFAGGLNIPIGTRVTLRADVAYNGICAPIGNNSASAAVVLR